ncbi:MAG: carboxypeptidase-like regulatory domain-containing protein [Acidobacteriaceae bacterium]
MQRVYRCLFCAFLVVLFNATLLWAAAPASLHGTITSVSGTPIAGVQVTVTNAVTGAAASAVTGPDGSFDLSGLAAGTYNVASTMQGFADYSQDGLTLQAGQNLSFQITMNLSSVSQTVKVTAEGSPETSVTQATISRAEIEGVAGPFGSAAQALTAAPGVFVYGYGGVAATARSEVVVRFGAFEK